MAVYFVEASNVNRIKIGFSRTPRHVVEGQFYTIARFLSLQAASPSQLTLLIEVWDMDERDEQYLHRIFYDQWHHNEWFEKKGFLAHFLDEVLRTFENLEDRASPILLGRKRLLRIVKQLRNTWTASSQNVMQTLATFPDVGQTTQALIQRGLTVAQTAKQLGISAQRLRSWRYSRYGPPSINLGYGPSPIRYRIEDVRMWAHDNPRWQTQGKNRYKGEQTHAN